MRATPVPVGWEGSPEWGERRSRYHLAARWVRGRVVLDCGPDEASGRAVLADAGAAMVIALPADWRLPLRAAAVDVAVCFGGLEQVPDLDSFARELRRVVRPGGRAVISAATGFASEDLQLVLKRHFSTVEMLAQVARPAYRINPHWLGARAAADAVSGRWATRVWAWQRRLPIRLVDRFSRLVHDRAFYPGEYDWVFRPGALDAAHVAVAICEP